MKAAFVIIDVQNFYFPGGDCELYHTEETADVIQNLIKKFREKKIPIIYVQHLGENNDVSPAEEINVKITPQPEDTIVIKHRPNSFYKTNLHEYLQVRGITKLYVCGMMSHKCVDTTVRAAKDLEYDITVIDDACTTMSLEWNDKLIPAWIVHDTYMASLNGSFAEVVTSENLVIE